MPAGATAKRSVTSKAKTASNKAAAAKSANGAGSGRRSADATFELANKIKAAREAGKSWGDIKSTLGVDPAQGQYLIKVASVRPKDRIKFTSDSDLGKQAKALYKAGVSKAEIAARASMSVGAIRKLIGDVAKPKSTAAAKAPAKAKAKSAPKAKATAAGKPAAKADAANGAGEAQPKVRRRRRSQVAEAPSPAA